MENFKLIPLISPIYFDNFHRCPQRIFWRYEYKLANSRILCLPAYASTATDDTKVMLKVTRIEFVSKSESFLKRFMRAERLSNYLRRCFVSSLTIEIYCFGNDAIVISRSLLTLVLFRNEFQFSLVWDCARTGSRSEIFSPKMFRLMLIVAFCANLMTSCKREETHLRWQWLCVAKYAIFIWLSGVALRCYNCMSSSREQICDDENDIEIKVSEFCVRVSLFRWTNI